MSSNSLNLFNDKYTFWTPRSLVEKSSKWNRRFRKKQLYRSSYIYGVFLINFKKFGYYPSVYNKSDWFKMLRINIYIHVYKYFNLCQQRFKYVSSISITLDLLWFIRSKYSYFLMNILIYNKLTVKSINKLVCFSYLDSGFS